MTKTVITTDSGCNPRDISNMIPSVVIDSNDNSYCDTKRVTSEDKRIITNMEALDRAKGGEKLRTASPVINDFLEVMRKHLDDGFDIVHLAMSSGISYGSVNSSRVAADILNDEYGSNRVTVIDTLTGGSGGTIINDYANSLVKKGLTSKEIVKELEEVKKRLLTSFYISKVEGFVKSGRAPAKTILSDKLLLRYRIDINDKGKLFPKLPPYHGKINSQFIKYLKNIINEKNMEEYDPNYFSLLITRLNEIDIEEAKNYLLSLNYFNKELLNELEFYSVICAYGVEDQIGIGLIKKKHF